MMMHLNLQVMKNRPLSELVIDFINDQDVNELSKKTYKLAISRFVRWVVFSTLEFWSLKKKDIINYKPEIILNLRLNCNTKRDLALIKVSFY